MNIVQNLKRNTFLILFTLFTIYNLNDSYVIYKNYSTFQKEHVGQ